MYPIIIELKEKIIKLNLFENEISLSSAFHHRTAIISTRIYIFLLLLSVNILIGYTLFKGQSQTITIQNPTETIYKNLFNKYQTTLQCQCSQIAISYGSFLSISPQYHPICSSIYIQDQWIELLFNSNTTYFLPIDFRSLASSHFQLLATLCSFVQQIVHDAIDDFLSNTFLSPQILSEVSLEQRSYAESSFLRISTANNVKHLLHLIRNLTQSNRLQTALSTATINMLYYDSTNTVSAFSWTDIFNLFRMNCSCSFTTSCYLPSGFYNHIAYDIARNGLWHDQPMGNVTGFKVGCYAIEGILQSTLECFFNSQCLTMIQILFPISPNINIYPFNHSQTRFSSITTIEELTNELFLETWLTIISFSNYYNHCIPYICTYRYTQRNILYVITKLLGIYGGLTAVLRVCIPLIVTKWRNQFIRQRSEKTIRTNGNKRFDEIWEMIKIKIFRINLFDDVKSRSDPFALDTAIISTRIYLILLCMSTGILISYTAVTLHMSTIIIRNPSEMIYDNLLNQYKSTLKCPCSQIAIEYSSFVSLSPVYHQVCSSPFISDIWTISSGGKSFSAMEFKAIQSFFIILKVFCSLTEQTVSDAWRIFNQSVIITSHTISSDELIIRTKDAFNQFESQTATNFKHIISLIQSYLGTMFSTLENNVEFASYQPVTNGSSVNFKLIPTTKQNNCSCALNNECLQIITYTGITISDRGVIYPVPTLYVGCSMVQAVLRSTLECFFNQTCFDAFKEQNIYLQLLNVSILQESKTRFSSKTMIGTLVDELMIERWNEQINFSRYYTQCASPQCSYTLILRNNVLSITTTVVGLLGGLSVALRLTIPFFVNAIRNRIYRRRNELLTDRTSTFSDRFYHAYNLLKEKALEFNLFEHQGTNDNAYHLKTQIISTRIYLLLLILSISILIVYTLLIGDIKYVTIQYPSLNTFEQLESHKIYSSTLNCLCQNLSIQYDTFISISYRLHQLCSSDIFSINFLNLIYNPLNTFNYSYFDYRLFILPQFRWLNSLCTLANSTFNDALIVFYSNTLVTGRVQSRTTIQIQIDTALTHFYLSTSRAFLRALDFIQQVSQGNGIISEIESNWYFTSRIEPIQYASLWTEPRSYYDHNSSCSCSINHMCTSVAMIDEWIIPGFRVGCYPLQSLLQSTLECLYNQTCLNQLKSIYFNSDLTFQSLDPTLSSPNVTVQTLINKLLVDRLEHSIDYNQYYSSCAPISCTYSYNQRVDSIYLVTSIIGLFGGLTIALKLFVPMIVKTIRHFKNYHHRNRTIPLAVREIPDTPSKF
ncbi:unnamed protein product [Rotaria sordida]|uniref:Uncharacterized protein n=1 Tax=Rotaria sordida TaxID=392033 RepID=A0A814CR65_9BILA|nr:unnamed protein product [Rotaria sordida]CAF1143465.1 unnamed protein product [Rotaria sordida]